MTAEKETKKSGKPARLYTQYVKTIAPQLQKELELKSFMQVPRIKKITVNVGAGRAVAEPKILDSIVNEITAITGQKAVKTVAKKAIAGFKLREGLPIGVMVTLRGARMYEFFDRLINVALPRVRDFNGLNPKSFDHAGNYSFGIREQIIFPEINVDQIEWIHGMDIVINISSMGKDHSRKLLEKFNFPFKTK